MILRSFRLPNYINSILSKKKFTTSETPKNASHPLKKIPQLPTTSPGQRPQQLNHPWVSERRRSDGDPSGARRRVDRGMPRGWTLRGVPRLQGFTPRNENEQNFVGSKMLHILFGGKRPSFRNIIIVSGVQKNETHFRNTEFFWKITIKTNTNTTKIVSTMSCGSGSLRVRTLGQIRWKKCTEPNNQISNLL